MTALLALIRKDLLLFLADRRALLLTLLMPVMLGAFFGYLFGGSGVSDNSRINIALVSLDQSEMARKIVASLQADVAIKMLEMPLEQAKEKVLAGKLSAVLLLPSGFSEAAGAAFFGAPNKPVIELYYDPSQAAALAMLKGMLTQHVMQQVSAEMFSGASAKRMIDDSIANLERSAGNAEQNAALHDFLLSLRKFQSRPLAPQSAAASAADNRGTGLSMPFVTKEQAMSSGPKYNGYAHSFAGMAVQFILFMGIDAGIGILLARRQGLWSRLLAAPITLNTVLLARALSAALIACFMLLFIFVVASLFFQVRVAGSMLGFVGVCISFSMVTASFGLLIAAFGKTPDAARSIAIFATLIMVMLGGAWVPTFLFPQWLQSLTLWVPTRWAVDGLDAMTWRGLGLSEALPAILAQLGFATLFAGLARWKFNRDSDS